jgi:arylsulfatase A-like enzyme
MSTAITRRSFVSLASGSALPGQQRSARRRMPNFLFLLADDHAGYALGADGNRLAATPNLDRLASDGTRFSRHYCNSPVCTASRQSLFTGILPHANGVTRLLTPLAADRPTLARTFRKAGYETAAFGKMHFNRPDEPGLHGFDHLLTEGELQRAWQQDVKPRPIPPDISTKPQWRPFRDPARVWLNADTLPFPRYEEEMKGTYLANRAIEYLNQRRERPFALWVSFMEPHSPYDFPVEDRGRLKPAQFTVPRVGPEDGGQVPLIFRDLSDHDKRGINAAYYTSVGFLDRNVGRVLHELRRLNLEEETFVVYMADHGYNLGQHGRFEKHCGYDPALRVPLIMRWPGRIRSGAIQDLTQHIDVPATICDMMDLDPLAVMHGQSLRPYLEKGTMDAPLQHVFSEYLDNEEAYIRTSKWKFIFCSGKRKRTDGYETDNPTPGRYRRLYDLEKDAGEFTNLAAKHPAVVAELEDVMLRRLRSTHPDRDSEPQRLSRAEAIEYYLRPRDAD